MSYVVHMVYICISLTTKLQTFKADANDHSDNLNWAFKRARPAWR